MNRRAAHRWLTWLLPLLLLRAFVPAGFMLGSDLQPMLCSGIAVVASHHEHHHAGHGAEHSGGQVHEKSICLFAAAGSASLPMPAYVPVAFVFEPLEHVTFLADPELRAAPVLIDRIRGPPAV